MSIDQFTNFAASAISGGSGGPGSRLLAADTSLILGANEGQLFPASGPFMIVIGPDTSAPEVVKCTARSTDTVTIVRAQEGTTAQIWPVGTIVQHVITAGNMANIWANMSGSGSFTSLTVTGISSLDNATILTDGSGNVTWPDNTTLWLGKNQPSGTSYIKSGGSVAIEIDPSWNFVVNAVNNITLASTGFSLTISGASSDIAFSTARHIVSNQPLMLTTGNQESGPCGMTVLGAAGGETIKIAVKYRQKMSNTPSGITFSSVSTTNANSPTATSITQDGFTMQWTIPGAGLSSCLATYTTVGN